MQRRLAKRRPDAARQPLATPAKFAFVLGGQLGSEFLPQLDEGTIWVRANFPAGISLAKSAEVARHIRHILGRPSRKSSW